MKENDKNKHSHMKFIKAMPDGSKHIVARGPDVYFESGKAKYLVEIMPPTAQDIIDTCEERT